MEFFRDICGIIPSNPLPCLRAKRENIVIATFVDTPATEGKPNKKLFDQIRGVMRLKQYALRTERAYIHWIRRLISFHGKK